MRKASGMETVCLWGNLIDLNSIGNSKFINKTIQMQMGSVAHDAYCLKQS